MSVWVTIPSARPVAEVEAWAKEWKDRGYKIALWRDDDNCCGSHCCAGGGGAQYPGYAAAVNSLVKGVLGSDYDCDFCVIGGDDVFPDPNKSAEEIARECAAYFTKLHYGNEAHHAAETGVLSTYGVMQATGDRWGENPNHPRPDMRSAYIDRVAGSAWLGREFCKRVNQGHGPLWPEYQHMWVDEELRAVAVKLGIYWERRDLTHHHQHAGRVKHYTEEMIPEHLKKWTIGEAGRKHWKEAETLFFKRRDAGFPGSEPL